MNKDRIDLVIKDVEDFCKALRDIQNTLEAQATRYDPEYGVVQDENYIKLPDVDDFRHFVITELNYLRKYLDE